MYITVSQKTSPLWQAVALTLLLTYFVFKQLWRKWCDLKQRNIVTVGSISQNVIDEV